MSAFCRIVVHRWNCINSYNIGVTSRLLSLLYPQTLLFTQHRAASQQQSHNTVCAGIPYRRQARFPSIMYDIIIELAAQSIKLFSFLFQAFSEVICDLCLPYLLFL